MIAWPSRLGILAIAGVLTLSMGCGPRSESDAKEAKKPSFIKRQVEQDTKLPDVPVPTFEDRTAQAGITWRLGYKPRPKPLTLLEIVPGGCAAVDLDGDGNTDLLFLGIEGVGNTGKCALYKGKGDGTFTDVTAGSGIETPGFYMGCAVADIQNDGKPDIVLTGYGVVRLYINLGNLRFRDATAGSGLEAPTKTTFNSSAGFADYDRDGLPDLYIGRYAKFDSTVTQWCNYSGVESGCGPLMYDAEIGSLYKNLGNGKFQDVTVKVGMDSAHGKCLGVVWCDYNNDGWPDLYLGNDEMTGDLFLNEKGKRFKNVGVMAGVALTEEGQFHGAMGVDFGDFDRDGKFDLVVTTFQNEATALYRNNGDGLFTNLSRPSGVDMATRPLVGFGVRFVDLDNDGWLDLPIANGHIYSNAEQVDKNITYAQPMHLLMNFKGERFYDRAKDAGPGFAGGFVGRALAASDLNNDGLVDLVAVDLEGAPRVLINTTKNPRKWLRVTLEGRKSNRMALGAVVTVKSGQAHWVAQCTTSGSYLTGNDPRVHFGLGDIERVDSVEVRWPNGAVSSVKNPKVPGDLKMVEP